MYKMGKWGIKGARGEMMKRRILLVFGLIFIFGLLLVNSAFALSKYEIREIVGLRLGNGLYKANVSREDSNLYLVHEINGRRVSDCYVHTKYCYEYGRRVDVFIEITNQNSNYSIGTIYF